MFAFPTKATATVLDETVEYFCTGSGPATVVLVNGSGGPIEGWHKIISDLAASSTVFAYNRPGIGKSSKPSVPQTGLRMVASLRAALSAAGLKPPYLLVGHSLGGLVVNLFARLHPSEISAVALIEATTPNDVEHLPKYETALQRNIRKLAEWLIPSHPNAEARHLSSTLSELRQAPSFPPVPLIVMSGAKPAMAWATDSAALDARATFQSELVSLSPLGRHVIATRSGHFPQLSEPHLVVETIGDLAKLSVDQTSGG